MITYDEMLQLFGPDVIDSIARIHKRQSFSELERKLLVFIYAVYAKTTGTILAVSESSVGMALDYLRQNVDDYRELTRNGVTTKIIQETAAELFAEIDEIKDDDRILSGVKQLLQNSVGVNPNDPSPEY